MEDGEVGVRSDLPLEELRRHVAPAIHDVPAAELHLAELFVLEGVPVGVALPVQLLVVPAQELQVVFRLVVLEPLDELVVGDPGLALGAPELGRPRKDTVVVVEPVVPAALDLALRVVLEVVEDRDGRVAGALRRLLSKQLVGAEVEGRVVVVVVARVGAEMNSREGVVGDVAGDVRAGDDGFDERPCLRLRDGKRARPALLGFGRPLHREVPVQVEALDRRRDLDRKSTRLNSSHITISYAVFCLKKKKKQKKKKKDKKKKKQQQKNK